MDKGWQYRLINKGTIMSKDNKVVEKVENKENNVAKEVNKEKEVIETLRVQLQEHLQQAEHHRTMATKAQGALEVLLQMHPQEKQEN
jgi:hypothetical protein